MFIDERAVSAVHICQQEAVRISGVDCDLGVFASDQVVAIGVIFDRRRSVAAKYQLAVMFNCKLLDLIRFRTAQVFD